MGETGSETIKRPKFKNMKLGIQTFTIRKLIKSPGEITKAFKKLSEMGVESVELARIKFTKPEIEAVRAASLQYNIEIGSTQITFDYLEKNFDWVVEFHKTLECKYVCVSVLPTKYIIGNERKLREFTARLNQLGMKFRENGLFLLYHHHHFEFRKYGMLTGFEIIEESVDPNAVHFVLDTYWLQRAGLSPHDFIRERKGKVKVVHLRDHIIRWKGIELKSTDTELGEGSLDFKKIKAACEESGVEYYAIEQDTQTPMESLRTSLKYFKNL